MWFKADSSDLAALSDGDSVSSWTNQSTPQNVTQVTSTRQPTLQTNELNGKPVVRFDGTNDILSDGTVSDLNVGTGDVWFATVAKVTNTGGVSFVWEKGSTQLGLLSTKNGTLSFRLGSSTSVPLMNSGNWTRTDFFMTSASRVSSTCNGFLNGSAADTTGTTNTASINNSSVFDVGASAIGGNTLNGDVGEILVGGGTLLESERVKIESYLDDKYGLDTLPSTHEYKEFVAATGVHGVHNQDLIGELVLDVSGPVVSDTLAGVV
tara:strand:+ start:881 stop:1675 length:795 start_codon:yes stop_codon:yes gene_type:complete